MDRDPTMRRRCVATKDGRQTCDGFAMGEEKEVEAQPSKTKIKTTSAVQDVVLGENRKRKCVATGDSSTSDVGSKEPPKPKMANLQTQESRSVRSMDHYKMVETLQTLAATAPKFKANGFGTPIGRVRDDTLARRTRGRWSK